MADHRPANHPPPDHVGHDPELIVALLDHDLTDGDRELAETRLRECPECAALHADVVALAAAGRQLATPARPRDFALTPRTAAMLRAAPTGEPVPTGARLSGDMTVSRSAHAVHDRLLIANLVDRSVSEHDRTLAEAQLTACSDCARLYADLVALSAATKAMATPPRPRDFTLTSADAERLRVRGWRRVLARFGSPGDVFSRPLAIGLTTLGIAGLLVATVPAALPGFGGGAASLQGAEDAARNATGDSAGGSAANPEFLAQEPSAASAPEAAAPAASGPTIAAAGPSAAPSEAAVPAPAASEATPPEILAEGGESNPLAGEPEDRGAFDTYFGQFGDTDANGPSPTLVVATLLLVLGLGLFGLRWTARRLGDG